MAVSSGLFVTFEGGEGAGKSTQIRRLADDLRAQDYHVVVTREPGGSPGAEAVRHVILSGAAEDFGVRMEALLFAAARNDHVEEVIKPALARGSVVLCDRFMDSSRVYQGVTGNLPHDFIANLERVAINGTVPDCTIIFDLPAAIGLARAKRRMVDMAQGTEPDRFEKEEIGTHEKRREAFLEIAANNPLRCRVVDARQDLDTVASAVFAAVQPLLPIRSTGERAGRLR